MNMLDEFHFDKDLNFPGGTVEWGRPANDPRRSSRAWYRASDVMSALRVGDQGVKIQEANKVMVRGVAFPGTFVDINGVVAIAMAAPAGSGIRSRFFEWFARDGGLLDIDKRPPIARKLG